MPQSLNTRPPLLPYFRFAWLIPAAWVCIFFLLLATDIPVPIPHTLTLAVIVVSALMGGRLSGFLSAFFPVLAGICLFYFVPNATAVRSLEHLALASAVTLGLGFLIGSVRESLEMALTRLEPQSEQVAGQNAIPAQQVDENSEALSANRKRLLESQERLRNATRRLIDAQESERRSLARELHNDIGQSLTALRINLESNKRNFSQNDTPLKFIETSYRLVDEIIASVRELSLNLRPSLLDDLGLVAALREYVSKQLGRADIRLDFSVDGTEAAIDPTHSIAAYRIVQEIISNIVKHSSAESVDMLLAFEAQHLRITVHDDGVGFDVDLDKSEQIGLASLRERASLLGGNVEITSTLGSGTVVSLQMPLSVDLGKDAAA